MSDPCWRYVASFIFNFETPPFSPPTPHPRLINASHADMCWCVCVSVWKPTVSKVRREYYCIISFLFQVWFCMSISLHCNDACKLALCHESVCFKTKRRKTDIFSCREISRCICVWENIIYGVKKINDTADKSSYSLFMLHYVQNMLSLAVYCCCQELFF